MVANYFLLQHIPNPFRKEAMNVGLIVSNDREVAAKFYGEKSPGQVDRRRVSGLSDPGIYVQWVEYWRYELEQGEKGIQEIRKSAGANFRLLPACEVNSQNGDTPKDILRRLYPTLVDSKGLRPHGTALQELIETEFKRLNIYETKGSKPRLGVNHPVYRRRVIRGQTIPFRPTFVQESAELYLIEAIEGHNKQRLIEKSIYASGMFKDIAAGMKNRKVVPISIINSSELPAEDNAADDAMVILRGASAVVDWNMQPEREEFLSQREAIAFS